MRSTSLLIGICLVSLAGAALYQGKNGFFRASLSALSYEPPSDPAEIPLIFDDLGNYESLASGVLLINVAEARLTCAQLYSGVKENPDAETAFMRLNLMLLAAGAEVKSKIIDPDIHYLAEIRRDLAQDKYNWREPKLNEEQAAALKAALENLTSATHPVFADLDMSAENYSDFSRLADAMMAGGEALNKCVERGKF
jgi:hypothetical protein